MLISEKMNAEKREEFLTKYASVFLVLFSITFIPLEPRGFGAYKLVLMISSIIVFFYASRGKFSRAWTLGLICLALQLLSAYWNSATFRASTFFFSCGFYFMYISFYNLICQEEVFSIPQFIRLLKVLISLFFVFCILQQICILVGLHYFPLINLTYVLGRGLGCNSLCLEPSHFARYLLVFYYAYLKCNEYQDDKGNLSLKDLLSSEHRITTLMFLWMMLTMGSGTAFVCLGVLSLYFINKRNWFYVFPFTLFFFFLVNTFSDFSPLQRATAMGEAITSFDQKTVIKTDASAASRITPILNSFDVDLTSPDTWFGKGIDANTLQGVYNRTLFDDYGLLYYLASMALSLCCAYRFNSLGFIFLILGIGGGATNNVYYAWYLMIIMTCVRHFHDKKYDLNSREGETSIIIINEED